MFISAYLSLVTISFSCLYCEVVQRKLEGDFIQDSVYCDKCTCPKTAKTYLGIQDFEKCIGPKTGCGFSLLDYPDDIPLITKQMLDKTEFSISYNSQNICNDGHVPSHTKVTVQNTIWQEASEDMNKSITIKGAQIKFHKIWSGLLFRIQFGCRRSGHQSVYYPSNNCVLFKYEGEVKYPLNIKRISTQMPDIKTALPSIISTLQEVTTESDTSTNTVHTTVAAPPTPQKNGNTKGIIVAIITTLLFIIVLLIVVIICFRRKSRRQQKREEEICRSGENLYEQVNPDQPKEDFANKAYENHLHIYQSISENKQHNYANTLNTNYCSIDGTLQNNSENTESTNNASAKKYDEIWEKPKENFVEKSNDNQSNKSPVEKIDENIENDGTQIQADQ